MSNVAIHLFDEYITLARRAVNMFDDDYRRGYLQGLRQRYHGERHDAPDEHTPRRTVASVYANTEMGRGYRDGLAGVEPQPFATVARQTA